MNDNNDKNNINENESNAARRIRLRGEDMNEPDNSPLKIDKWANFWYHHKTKVIMISFFSIMILIGLVQLLTRQNPDVYILYSGPDYITPNQNVEMCDALEEIMIDYNGDGKVYAQLNDLVFMTADQIKEYESEARADGEEPYVDLTHHKNTHDRFVYEVFGQNSSICILAPDQYEIVKAEGGFLPLSELFDEVPEGAIDEYGINLVSTKFAEFYPIFQIFPEDTVIALRRLSTMSALGNKKKAEIRYEYHVDLFEKIISFEFPEGYTPKSK